MVEAIQIATEGRVRALYEAGIQELGIGSRSPPARAPIVLLWFRSAAILCAIAVSTLSSAS